MKKRSGLMSIEGFVSPCSWDEEGEIVALELITEDGRDVEVEHSGAGASLLDYVDEYIQARGTLTKKQGRLRLLVKDFEVLDAPEVLDEDEEDWPD
ncbi:hypothetical protein [Desulfocurvus sp. DL9XJH121]